MDPTAAPPLPSHFVCPAGLHPNGFSFEGTDAAGLDYALNRALSMWYSDRESWNELASDVMQQDWSWDGPSLDYLELYYKALKGNN
jgi:starch synthase